MNQQLKAGSETKNTPEREVTEYQFGASHRVFVNLTDYRLLEKELNMASENLNNIANQLGIIPHIETPIDLAIQTALMLDKTATKELCMKLKEKNRLYDISATALREAIAACVIKDEALKLSLKWHDRTPITELWLPDVIKQSKAALTNSPAAAQEMVERMDKVNVLLTKVPIPPMAISWELGCKLLDELQAISTTKQPEGDKPKSWWRNKQPEGGV